MAGRTTTCLYKYASLSYSHLRHQFQSSQTSFTANTFCRWSSLFTNFSATHIWQWGWMLKNYIILQKKKCYYCWKTAFLFSFCLIFIKNPPQILRVIYSAVSIQGSRRFPLNAVHIHRVIWELSVHLFSLSPFFQWSSMVKFFQKEYTSLYRCHGKKFVLNSTINGNSIFSNMVHSPII